MNELIKVNGLKVSGWIMTSNEISRIVEKEHFNVMKAIKDEIRKLDSKGLSSEFLFEFVENTNVKGAISNAYYKLSLRGALQIASRYKAEYRYILINMALESVETKDSIDTKSLPYKSIKLFIDNCVEDSQYDITSLTLYEYYITYCVKSKLNFTSRNVFLREFRKVYKDKYYKKIMFEGVAYRGYRNLEVNENKLLTI